MVATLLGLTAVVLLYLWLSRRANEVFCLSLRGEETLLVRGRIPRGLDPELAELLRRGGVDRATVRCVRENGQARVVLDGGDERLAQRVRNVFGNGPWRDLKFAQPAPQKNLGQRLGWTWLAWRLHDAQDRSSAAGRR